MSKTINGRKWHNGREIYRVVCNLLGGHGMAVVNWVDMSDYGIDRREDRTYNMQLVFTMFRAQRDGKFVTVVQMAAIPMDGRTSHVSDFTCAEPGGLVTDELIAELLHNVVDDDSEPQYTVVNDDDDDEGKDAEGGWYVSDGGTDSDIVYYTDTEWPFKEENKPHSSLYNEFVNLSREELERISSLLMDYSGKGRK